MRKLSGEQRLGKAIELVNRRLKTAWRRYYRDKTTKGWSLKPMWLTPALRRELRELADKEVVYYGRSPVTHGYHRGQVTRYHFYK